MVTKITSTTAETLPRTHALIHEDWLATVCYIEKMGTFSYQRTLTIKSNDVGNDLTAAIDTVLQRLRDLKYID